MVTTLRELVLSGVTSGTSAEFDIGGTGLKNIECYAEWSAGVTGGTVMLESAARKGFTGGFWMNEGTTTFAASNTTRVGVTNRALGAIRARISVTVVGGTVDVYLTGN